MAARTPKHRPRLADLKTASAQRGGFPAVKTLRTYIRRGDLTGYRVGPRRVMVDLDELDALVRPIPAADKKPA